MSDAGNDADYCTLNRTASRITAVARLAAARRMCKKQRYPPGRKGAGTVALVVSAASNLPIDLSDLDPNHPGRHWKEQPALGNWFSCAEFDRLPIRR